jgi:glycosyltransferase involved in cell wall biosynthesis
MRIGIVADPWIPVPPPAYGGTEQIIDIEARALVAAGHNVLLCTLGVSTSPVPRRSIIHHAGGYDIGDQRFALQHSIFSYEQVKDFDVVHDHTISGLFYSERWPNLPVVTTQHGPFDDVMVDLYRAVAERISIISISHSQAKSAPSGIPIARVIHHGVDAERFRFGTGEGDARGEYFFNLSRMAPTKGVKEAIYAAREAGVRLVIAAKMREAREQEYFEREIKPLLNEDIQYIGEVTFPEKVELLANAKGLLNPINWEEPFGLAMIESFAAGTPVIANRRGAAPEVVEQGITGFICDSHDDLVQAIKFIDTIDRAACREVTENYFSSARMAEDHLEFFDELMRPRKRTNNVTAVNFPRN